MKKFWKFIDGNKTIIGLILLNVTQLTFIKSLLGENIVPVQSLIGAFTGYGAIHHVAKGKLTTKSN